MAVRILRSKKNGYLYVYVSNESQGNVYFDDLVVTHTKATCWKKHIIILWVINGELSVPKHSGKLENNYRYSGKGTTAQKSSAMAAAWELYDFWVRI